jgi:hypothetical protein
MNTFNLQYLAHKRELNTTRQQNPLTHDLHDTSYEHFYILLYFSLQQLTHLILNISSAKTTAPLISTNFQKTMMQFNNSSFDTNTAGLREQKG